MADEADIANDWVMRDLEMRLAAARAPEAVMGDPECQECGETVPDARRRLGKSICFDCADLAERRAKLFGRP
jgi:formylmethanofuran dehydrogenase subunit E